MSGKKGKKVTIKNLLQETFTGHLPLISLEETERITNALKSLPTVKLPRPKVPWSVLKKVSRDDRKAYRREFQDEVMQIDVDPNDNIQELRKCLCFGINESTKLLENNSAAAVLVAADVNPQFMIKHLSVLCALHKTPFLRVPELKTTLQRHTGISAAAIAFRPHKKLAKILGDIQEISLNYPLPQDHALYSYGDAKGDSEEEVIEIEDDDEVCEEKDYYLLRVCGEGRVFVPEASVKEVKWFMDLGGDDWGKNGNRVRKDGAKGDGGYKGLKVKRMRNNSKRKRKGGKMMGVKG